MKDHQLKALVQVAEQGSIRGAARALHLSQSALTKALRELEANVGAELLVRSYKGVEFTPAGQALLTRARLALSTLEKARYEIRWLRGGAGIQITAGVTPAIAATALPSVLNEFEREQPDASLTLVEGMLTNVLPGLMEGRIDFAIVAAKPDDLPYEIAFEPLGQIQVEAAARVDHPLLAATEWSQLLGARWVLNLAAGSSAQQLVAWLEGQGLGLSRQVVKCDSPTLMTEMMRRTDLIGFGPHILFQDPLSGQGLASFDSLPPVPPLTLGLLKLRGVPLHSGAQRLATLFERHITLSKLQ